MRRLLKWALPIAMVLALALLTGGCGKKDTAKDDAAAPDSATQEAPQTPGTAGAAEPNTTTPAPSTAPSTNGSTTGN